MRPLSSKLAAVLLCWSAEAWADHKTICEDWRNAQVDELITACSDVIRNDGKAAWAYTNRGIAYSKKSDLNRALADLNKAIAIDSKYVRAYYNRGIVYMNANQNDRAILEFTKAIEINPKFSQAYAARGLIYGTRGEHQQAFEEYNMAVTFDRRNAVAYAGRGIAHAAIGEDDRALADLGRAIKLDPKLALAYLNRGIVYEKKRENIRAITDYQTALTLEPSGEVHERARKALAKFGISPPRTATSSLPAPKPSPKNVPEGPSSGTGFLVSSAAEILTNAHVVRGCKTIQVKQAGHAPLVAHVQVADTGNDLALLKVEAFRKDIVASPFRVTVRVGESVFAYGFPLSGLLTSSGNFTAGVITANAGPNDDVTKLQFSAPVQPGNSGGPLFDKSGNIIGIVVATLRWGQGTSAPPQNVNFAIKPSVAIDFLRSHGVVVRDTPNTDPLPPEDVADRAAAVSVHVLCAR